MLYRGGLLAHSLACAVIISLVVALDRGWLVRGLRLAAAGVDRCAVVRAVPVALADLHVLSRSARASTGCRCSPCASPCRCCSRTPRSGWSRIRSGTAPRGPSDAPVSSCSPRRSSACSRSCSRAAGPAGRDRRVRPLAPSPPAPPSTDPTTGAGRHDATTGRRTTRRRPPPPSHRRHDRPPHAIGDRHDRGCHRHRPAPCRPALFRRRRPLPCRCRRSAPCCGPGDSVAYDLAPAVIASLTAAGLDVDDLESYPGFRLISDRASTIDLSRASRSAPPNSARRRADADLELGCDDRRRHLPRRVDRWPVDARPARHVVRRRGDAADRPTTT